MNIDQELRQKLNLALCSNSSPRKRWATRIIADQMPELEEENERRRACCFHRPCNRPECDHCGGGMAYRANTKNDYIYSLRADKKQSRGKSKNYRSIAGKWLTEPFWGFPEHQCHMFTIDLSVERRDMNGIEVIRRERPKFQSLVKREMPEAVVRMICDISVCAAHKQFSFIPNDSIHPSFLNGDRMDQVAMNFHGHGRIWHPYLTQYQIAKRMRDFYPGAGRVCFSYPYKETETPDGYLSGGVQGWCEYAGLEKSEAKLPFNDPDNDNVAAVRDMLMIRHSWPRKARKIIYGDKAARVNELQLLSSLSVPSSECSSIPSIVTITESADDFYGSSPEYIPSITSPAPSLAQ